MAEIKIDHSPTDAKLAELGVKRWPIWTKEVSTFPWHYDSAETCYILEGEIEVTPDGGAPVQIGVGDLVTFPRGMSCTWKISQPVRKHYSFEE